MIPRTSLPIRPLKLSTFPFVCGVRGRVWRYSAPNRAQACSEAGVKQLPLPVSTCVSRKGHGVGFTQEGDGTLLGFIVFHGQMR